MESEKLLIRKFQESDLDDFKELIRDKMGSNMSAYDDQYPTDDASLKSVLQYFMTTDFLV